MNNITNMKFSLSDDESLKFNGMTPYQYTDREVKIKSISANGTPLEPDADKNVDIPLASENNNGVMSSKDKAKLNGIEEKAQVNKIEKIKLGDAEASVKNKTVEIPYAKAQEPEVSTGIGQLEYFGGLMSGEDKEKVDTIPKVYSPLPTRDEVVLIEEEDGKIVTFITLKHNKVITECICDLVEFNPIEKYIVTGSVFENTDLKIFNSEIVWKTNNGFQPQIAFPSEWVFVGNIDIEDNILVPQKNMVYDIVVEGKGTETDGDLEVVVRVSGYEVS